MSKERPPEVRKVVPYKHGKRVSTVRKLNLDFGGTALEQALAERDFLEQTAPPDSDTAPTLPPDSTLPPSASLPAESTVPSTDKQETVEAEISVSTDTQSPSSEGLSNVDPPSIPVIYNVPVSDLSIPEGTTLPRHTRVIPPGTVPDSPVPDQNNSFERHTTAIICSDVPGETRIPNTILDGLLSVLDPFQQAVYLRLYRLSHGEGKDTCIVGLPKLAKATHMGKTSAQQAVEKLEQLRLIKRLGAIFGGNQKGNIYQVFHPTVERDLSPPATLPPAGTLPPGSFDPKHRAAVIGTYQSLTGNTWKAGDDLSYDRVRRIPEESLIRQMHLIRNRASGSIQSFDFFAAAINNDGAEHSDRSSGVSDPYLSALRKLILHLKRSLPDEIVSDPSSFLAAAKQACLNEGMTAEGELLLELAQEEA